MSEQSWRWIWQPDLGEGVEQFRFRATPGGYEARGAVVATLEGAPLKAGYTVETDTAWVTRRVQVDGCIDPDISMTPFTNTLAIRRLGLKAGEAADIKVAYVLVPELSLRAAAQRYTRLAERLWRFDGLDIDFTADLMVDEGGFVVEYPGLFRRD
jgi:hypothetical protein